MRMIRVEAQEKIDRNLMFNYIRLSDTNAPHDDLHHISLLTKLGHRCIDVA